jgi:hypothetical protein
MWTKCEPPATEVRSRIVPDVEPKPKPHDDYVTIQSPLAECFEHCEIHCVVDCCGLNAISSDRNVIHEWMRTVGPDTVKVALTQIDDLIAKIQISSRTISISALCHRTFDKQTTDELMAFLQSFKSAFEDAACSLK